MYWNIYRIDSPYPNLKAIPLGRVQANHHPAALLKAFKKFGIVTQNEQVRIHAIQYNLDHMNLGPQSRR